MDLKTYKGTFGEDDSPGWMAIDAACEALYKTDEPLAHFAPELPPIIGGKGPDGVSIYRSGDHYHYVSYGFSTLHYDEDAAGGEFSGYGFELTFRLKHADVAREKIPLWPVSVMQNLWAYVTSSGRWFEHGHCAPTVKSPLNSDLSFKESVISGVLFWQDPELGEIETPHGQVGFLQMVGITVDEANAHSAGDLPIEDLVERLLGGNALLVTDMKRGM